jgi:hypothetical protein
MAKTASPLIAVQPFIRDASGGDRLELFFIAAVSSIIFTRFFLALTGYPQLGGNGLHIAHVLPGGLLMMVALVMLMAFLNRGVKPLAAVIGGIGFGLFIDELGKFITSDTDYFFEPTIMLIYIIFLVLFFAFRSLGRIKRLNDRESLVNALELTKDITLHDLDARERRQVMRYLKSADPKDPITKALTAAMNQIESQAGRPNHLLARLQRRASAFYRRLTRAKWFRTGLVAYYVLGSLITVWITVVGVKFDDLNFTVIELGRLIPSTISALLVLTGAVMLFRNRLKAYEYFRASLLVAVFVTQLFVFYQDQILGVFFLGASLISLATIQYMISEERRLLRR